MSNNDAAAIALAQLARDISAALDRFAHDIAPGGTDSASSLPWSERVLRQSAIIQDILAVGGNVTRDEWKTIAAKYGYSGRGLAGFFRSGKNGLLEMRGERIYVTPNGRTRLKENKDRLGKLQAVAVADDVEAV